MDKRVLNSCVIAVSISLVAAFLLTPFLIERALVSASDKMVQSGTEALGQKVDTALDELQDRIVAEAGAQIEQAIADTGIDKESLMQAVQAGISDMLGKNMAQFNLNEQAVKDLLGVSMAQAISGEIKGLKITQDTINKIISDLIREKFGW